MKATINGIEVSGTPKEIKLFIDNMNMTTKPKTDIRDFIPVPNCTILGHIHKADECEVHKRAWWQI